MPKFNCYDCTTKLQSAKNYVTIKITDKLQKEHLPKLTDNNNNGKIVYFCNSCKDEAFSIANNDHQNSSYTSISTGYAEHDIPNDFA